MRPRLLALVVSFLLGLCPAWALAQGIGKIRVLSGEVAIERAGQRIAGTLGAPVFQADRIVTGPGGSVGLLFDDDSRLALGPNSNVALDRFAFDLSSHEGGFDVSVRKGTLSVVSGKLTAKRPGALKVRTPAAILAVRGTEFSVLVEDTGTAAESTAAASSSVATSSSQPASAVAPAAPASTPVTAPAAAEAQQR